MKKILITIYSLQEIGVKDLTVIYHIHQRGQGIFLLVA
jgi:hypothetical protein